MNLRSWTLPSNYGTRIDTVGIVVHHTAVVTDWEAIDAYHSIILGWGGIGYNIGIDLDGSVTVFGGLSDWRAHTYRYNSVMVGLAFMTGQDPNKAQVQAGVEVVRWLRSMYGSIPLYRHDQLTATSCPGGWDITQLERDMLTDEQKQAILDHLAVLDGLGRWVIQLEHTEQGAGVVERTAAIKQVLVEAGLI